MSSWWWSNKLSKISSLVRWFIDHILHNSNSHGHIGEMQTNVFFFRIFQWKLKEWWNLTSCICSLLIIDIKLRTIGDHFYHFFVFLTLYFQENILFSFVFFFTLLRLKCDIDWHPSNLRVSMKQLFGFLQIPIYKIFVILEQQSSNFCIVDFDAKRTQMRISFYAFD